MLGIVTKEKLERIWNCLNESSTWEELMCSIEVVKRIEECEIRWQRGERGGVSNEELLRKYSADKDAEVERSHGG